MGQRAFALVGYTVDRPRSTQERADWAGQELGHLPNGRRLRGPPSRDWATGPHRWPAPAPGLGDGRGG